MFLFAEIGTDLLNCFVAIQSLSGVFVEGLNYPLVVSLFVLFSLFSKIERFSESLGLIDTVLSVDYLDESSEGI